ncbi:MAG TPA: hypothetical protein PKO15_13980 [Fibrobacteria bacterium]|nr:hypothetical protein [Fibrobacteria bacterium]HOX51461.1 hypothetical protein [Fibrobacteria bacterium]
MATDLEGRLLERIDQERIRPYPRWVGWLTRGASGAAIAAALACSTLASSVFFLWVVQGADPGPHRGFRWVMIGLLPWLSLASAALLSWIGWRLFRRTGTGYRRRAWVVTGIFLVVSLAAGAGLQVGGGLFAIHRVLAMESTTYREFFQGRRSMEWSRPEEGRLAGIVSARSARSLELVDPRGRTWTVEGAVPEWVGIGMEIRLEGRTESDNHFAAERIDRFGPGAGSGRMHRGSEGKGCQP